ncbi:hypothetical protein G3576_10120 [Roseomonas stagni]|uniref:DUF2161 domain-containing phosphodiesterase n=1 Tax=Falsiroseomonas algicola TaxID=2716930 RepID=A0A6M1LJA7_9PROT|nr:DUF2161 family putative PD-(D/E)XK-type phosphodiesterase [Falsiroseomonas algicola]NGM20370.1 hypothetical protein [Falsiroseomonas algicola]
MPKRAPETSLYAAVKAHLERLGLEPKGEVLGCDVVALGAGDPPLLVIAEMKGGFTLELLLQGVDRLAACDEVWLAVPATRKGRDRDRRAHRLCRLLGFGLLAVLPGTGRVEVLAEPSPYRPRPNLPKRSRLLAEHRKRRGDPTPGGGNRKPIMTAYRQAALACAGALRDGPATTRAVKAVVPDAPTILLRNVHGWFERVSRGTYRLTSAGEAALAQD